VKENVWFGIVPYIGQLLGTLGAKVASAQLFFLLERLFETHQGEQMFIEG
jgi:hypothetical protein